MSDEGGNLDEIEVNKAISLPEQHPRADPPPHIVPIPKSKEYEDLFAPGSLARLQLNVYQTLAEIRYIKRTARKYYEDPIFRNDFHHLKEMYHELLLRDDVESKKLVKQIRQLFPKAHF
jgi:hypothetical protein